LKTFELTIPKQYLDYINKEIKKPKRLNTELLELWLERELSIENKGTYGNTPTDESHITAQLLPNGNFKVIISEVIFGMYNPNHTVTKSTMKIYSTAGSTSEQIKSTLKNTSKSKKQPKTPFCGKVNPIGPQRYPKCPNPLEMGQIKCSNCCLSLQINCLNCGKPPFST
jgi:hypothetical protein